MNKLKFRVQPEQNGKRIDLALVELVPELSRRKIRSIIDLGGCYVNARRVRIASRVVINGDKIEMIFDENALSKRPQFDSKALPADFILFNDEHMVAINKPPGLPSQPTRDQAVMHAGSVLKKKLEDMGQPCPNLSLVHRLDKETSGVLLFAKSDTIMDALSQQFKKRSVKKEYWAACFGIPKDMEFKVSNFLSDIDAKTGKVVSVKKGGKAAETEFELVRFNLHYNVSMIRCLPFTGRSHQIRVHLADKNLPIVGDKKYGGRDKPKQLSGPLFELTMAHHFLHAHALEFDHPVDEARRIKLTASLPPNFEKFAKGAEIS